MYTYIPSGGSEGIESACNAGDLGSIPGLGSTWKREWLPTLVFLPGEFHGRRNLVGTVHGVTKSCIQLKQLSVHTVRQTRWLNEVRRARDLSHLSCFAEKGTFLDQIRRKFL